MGLQQEEGVVVLSFPVVILGTDVLF